MSCARRSRLSKSHLQFLFKKKRHLSLDKLPGLAKALRLSNEEEYFLYLQICKNSSRSAYVKSHFEKILSRLRHEKVVTTLPSPKPSAVSYEFLYEDALAMILHTLARLEDFQEDPTWIMSVLPIKDVTRDRIESTLKLLEEKGAFVRDSNGRLRQKEFPFWRPDPLNPRGQDVYRKGAEAVCRLLETPEVYKPSVYMLMSLAMDEERLRMAERMMIDLHHGLRALADQSVDPTATIFAGNFFMTLARLKIQAG